MVQIWLQIVIAGISLKLFLGIIVITPVDVSYDTR